MSHETDGDRRARLERMREQWKLGNCSSDAAAFLFSELERVERELDEVQRFRKNAAGAVVLAQEAIALREQERDAAQARVAELEGAATELLGGHFNLYKSVFGEGANPDDDIVRKQMLAALAGGKPHES